LAYGALYFRLTKYDEARKQTLLQHLIDIKKQVGIEADELKELRNKPEETAYIWRWFLRLHHRRRPGPGGPPPLTWSDIDGFFRRIRETPQRWEVELIEELDDVFMDVRYSEQKRVIGSAKGVKV